MRSRIACCHPGKIGDALLSLPTVRWLSQKHGTRVDFYTSEMCGPVLPLLRWQNCIGSAYVCPGYRIQNADCGVQPWEMPVPGGYDQVYQLGFRSRPDCRLVDFIARSVGAPDGLPIEYDCPSPDVLIGLPERFIVVSPSRHGWHRRLCRRLAERFPLPVVQIGTRDEYVEGIPGVDYTGLTLFATLALFHRAAAFLGPLSSQLVLAGGFRIPKIVPLMEENDLIPVETGPEYTYLRERKPDQVLAALLAAIGG